MDIDLGDIAHAPTTGARRVHETPLVAASGESLSGYGCLVEDPTSVAIEILRPLRAGEAQPK